VSQKTLTPQTVSLLEKRVIKAAELADLDTQLKPLVEATVKARGPGKLWIGQRLVELTAIERHCTSWKSLAEAKLSEKVIAGIKPDFTNTSTSYGAKVIANQRSR